MAPELEELNEITNETARAHVQSVLDAVTALAEAHGFQIVDDSGDPVDGLRVRTMEEEEDDSERPEFPQIDEPVSTKVWIKAYGIFAEVLSSFVNHPPNAETMALIVSTWYALPETFGCHIKCDPEINLDIEETRDIRAVIGWNAPRQAAWWTVTVHGALNNFKPE